LASATGIFISFAKPPSAPARRFVFGIR
jgi:hypothetical protein